MTTSKHSGCLICLLLSLLPASLTAQLTVDQLCKLLFAQVPNQKAIEPTGTNTQEFGHCWWACLLPSQPRRCLFGQFMQYWQPLFAVTPDMLPVHPACLILATLLAILPNMLPVYPAYPECWLTLACT